MGLVKINQLNLLKMEKLVLVLLAVFLQQYVSAQEPITDEFRYKATYELSYQPDSTNVEHVLKEPMLLYIGDRISTFSSYGTAVGDSLIANAREKGIGMAALAQLRQQIPKTGFPYKIFKLKPSGKIHYAEKVARDNLLYEEDLMLMNWQIESETKELAGYKVQKAHTTYAGRRFTAWFTSEIPVSDGPYKFSGLPGLIVEISDEINNYHFLLTGFQNLKPAKAVTFDKKDYMTVKKEDFRKIKRNFELDPIAAYERAGITIHFTPKQEREAKKDLEEKRKARNNSLELE